MEFYDVVKSRYSCRKFAAKPVESEKLDRILDAGRLAPTAKNVQPVKVWVMQSQDSLEKIKSCAPFQWMNECPVVIAIGGTHEGAFVRPSDNRNFEDVDATIVATHIMLAIEAEGLGSTWVGFFDEPKVKALFPEMADYDLIALFPIGYPDKEASPSDRHTLRKSKSEFVKYM